MLSKVGETGSSQTTHTPVPNFNGNSTFQNFYNSMWSFFQQEGQITRNLGLENLRQHTVVLLHTEVRDSLIKFLQ